LIGDFQVGADGRFSTPLRRFLVKTSLDIPNQDGDSIEVALAKQLVR
jgi:hypothetical protein